MKLENGNGKSLLYNLYIIFLLAFMLADTMRLGSLSIRTRLQIF